MIAQMRTQMFLAMAPRSSFKIDEIVPMYPDSSIGDTSMPLRVVDTHSYVFRCLILNGIFIVGGSPPKGKYPISHSGTLFFGMRNSMS